MKKGIKYVDQLKEYYKLFFTDKFEDCKRTNYLLDSVSAYILSSVLFKRLSNEYFSKDNTYEDFKKAINEYKTNAKDPNYVKRCYKTIEILFKYYEDNKSLIFDYNNAYIVDLENLRILKNIDDEEIKNLRKELIQYGRTKKKVSASKYIDNDDHLTNALKDIQATNNEIYLSKGRYIVDMVTGGDNYFAAPTFSVNEDDSYFIYYNKKDDFTKVGGVLFGYRNSYEQWPKLRDYVLNTIPKIISKDFNEEQKVRAVQNFICSKLTYSHNELKLEDEYKDPNFKIRNPYTFLESKNPRGVCETYARMFSLFCTFLDIPCWYITGPVFLYKYNEETKQEEPIMEKVWDGEKYVQRQKFGGHAWTMVYVNHQYKFIDATWDDNDDKSLDVNDSNKFLPINYNYFLSDWSVFKKHRKIYYEYYYANKIADMNHQKTIYLPSLRDSHE